MVFHLGERSENVYFGVIRIVTLTDPDESKVASWIAVLKVGWVTVKVTSSASWPAIVTVTVHLPVASVTQLDSSVTFEAL
jgi:hypothetical protein